MTSAEKSKKGVALITGASGGIGLACANVLAQDGWDLALQFRSNSKPIDEWLGKQTCRVQTFECDLEKPSNASGLVADVSSALAAPTVLIHAAGRLIEKPVAFTSLAEWDASLELNASSGLLLSKAMMRGLNRGKWGRLIFIGSLAGERGLGNGVAYAASKGALAGLARTLALECSRWNVTANVIAPAYVETAMTAHHDEARRKKLAAQIPLGRYGKPEEVAGLARYLCSDQGAFMTGQVLCVDGGLSLV